MKEKIETVVPRRKFVSVDRSVSRNPLLHIASNVSGKCKKRHIEQFAI